MHEGQSNDKILKMHAQNVIYLTDGFISHAHKTVAPVKQEPAFWSDALITVWPCDVVSSKSMH